MSLIAAASDGRARRSWGIVDIVARPPGALVMRVILRPWDDDERNWNVPSSGFRVPCSCAGFRFEVSGLVVLCFQVLRTFEPALATNPVVLERSAYPMIAGAVAGGLPPSG